MLVTVNRAFHQWIKAMIPYKISPRIHSWTNDIDSEAMQQLLRTASLPFVYKHIAVMPDVHAGRGSTVGSVVPTRGAIVPACVGVDLGCGMTAVCLKDIDPGMLDGKLAKIRSSIENTVPVGFSGHQDHAGMKAVKASERDSLIAGLKMIETRSRDKNQRRILRGLDKFDSQMGSLGGGNHFIEICVSKNNEVWLLLHSGSRGVGNEIASYHIERSSQYADAKGIPVPHRDLSFLEEGTEFFDEYYFDMQWCQQFAYENRRAMQELILQQLMKILPFKKDPRKLDFIDCHHNYVSKETHFGQELYVTRKGAVRAAKGDLGIIPGSMGAKSYIVRGLGNAESFHSCSHGAGRRMSRTQAKLQFTLDDLHQQTMGIECRKDQGVIDEIPGAYKDIDQVMEQQKSLVTVEEELKQVLCIKG